jgi:hypothetical protein
MKKPFLRVALIPAVLLLVVASGCKVIETPDANLAETSIVLHERFCLQFDENRESGTFASEVVCDQFQDDILQWLSDNNVDLDMLCSIFMSGGQICLKPYTGHDWDITSKVMIERLDIADGPEELLKKATVLLPDGFYDESGKSARGSAEGCYSPSFEYRGVRIVNRALEDLVQGGNPSLKVTMASTDVDPEPSAADPLIFSWCACIDIVAVVATGDDDSSSGKSGNDPCDDNSSGSSKDGTK